MTESASFTGFPEETVKFFKGLTKNNYKVWFDEHKGDYENFVKAPAQAFVSDMGIRLREVSPKVNADPRVNKSIFRIYRDARFSKDKRPYKTHLGIFFWEGPGKKMECPGYYFHLEPPNLMLGAGLYMFPREYLEEYRESAVHKKYGPALAKAIDEINKKGPYTIGGTCYKRVPRGYDPEHKNAELLKHKGLFARIETRTPKELHSEALLDYCFEKWRDMSALHKWLVEMTARAIK